MEKIYFEAKAKKSQNLIKNTIKKLNVPYPNESLGFMHAIFAKFEEPNGNKVLLADSVKDDVPTLKFTQANYNHKREYGPILGCILDAWVNEDTNEIEIVFSFYKTLYPELWQEANDLLDKGKLTVSFELTVSKNNIELLNGGVRKLNKVNFEGVGILFNVKPAYKNAFVLETALQRISNMLNEETQELIYANAQEISTFWTQIGEQLQKALQDKQTGGNDIMDKKTNDALMAKFKEEITKELGEEAVKTWSDEQWESELQKRANPEEQTNKENFTEQTPSEASEKTKADVPITTPAEEAKEEKIVEAEKTTVKTEEQMTTTTTYDNETKIETITREGERVVMRDGKEVYRTKIMEDQVYNYAQVEAIKSEYENKLKEKDVTISAKEEKITFLKENAKKVIEIRSELGDFVKDLSDEDLLDESKVNTAKSLKDNAEKIVNLKTELKDNEFAKDFKDEDYLNNDKVENAKLKKENSLLKLSKENITDTKQEEKVTLETAHDEANQTNKEQMSEARQTYMQKKSGIIK